MPQAFSLVVAVTLFAVSPTGSAQPTGPAPSPAIGTVHVITRSAQDATNAFWTASRMEQATATQATRTQATATQATAPQGRTRTASPPPGTLTATPFGGVPTIGALFYTTGSGAHFCTASVVDSKRENLIMTAAHCVYSSGYSVNIEFVPGYHDGHRPYGTWLIQAVVVRPAATTTGPPTARCSAPLRSACTARPRRRPRSSKRATGATPAARR